MARFMNTVAALLLTAQVYSRVLDPKLYSRANVCPKYDVVSCTSSQDSIDKCCVPDQGHFVLAIQWLPSYCKNVGKNRECNIETLENVAKNTWTLHGLWPGNCDGVTYISNCNPEREVENIEEVIRSRDEDLLHKMEKVWASGNPDSTNNWFWAHEWNKHGQCVSTITPECLGDKYKENDDIITYFKTTLEFREKYDLYPVLDGANIVPDDVEGYPLDTLQNAISSYYNNAQVEINCVYNKSEKKQYMSEVRLCFHAKNKLELEGPVSCPKSYSRCDPKKPIFYAVNHAENAQVSTTSKTTTTITSTTTIIPNTTTTSTTEVPETTTTEITSTTEYPETIEVTYTTEITVTETETETETTTEDPETTTTSTTTTTATEVPETSSTEITSTTDVPETTEVTYTTEVTVTETTTEALETTDAPEIVEVETTEIPIETENAESSDDDAEEVNGNEEVANDDDSEEENIKEAESSNDDAEEVANVDDSEVENDLADDESDVEEN